MKIFGSEGTALNDTYQVSSFGHERYRPLGVQGTSLSKGGKRAHGRSQIEMNGALRQRYK